LLVAHHQEVTMYICNKWKEDCINYMIIYMSL
jgi:hypothetical protein